MTLGRIAGLTTGGMIGRTPGIPGTGGRGIPGIMPIAPGGRGGKGVRIIPGNGEAKRGTPAQKKKKYLANASENVVGLLKAVLKVHRIIFY